MIYLMIKNTVKTVIVQYIIKKSLKIRARDKIYFFEFKL